MRSLIIIHTGFQDQEVHYPFHRLREEGDDPVVMAEKRGLITGVLGTQIEATDTIAKLDHMQSFATLFDEFELLVLPGGVKAMEKLRQHQPTLTFIAGWMHEHRPVACMCSGVQLLISAKVVQGRELTCYPAFGIDVENAGGKYVPDVKVVIDKNLITSPHHKWLAEWMFHSIKSTANKGAWEKLPPYHLA